MKFNAKAWGPSNPNFIKLKGGESVTGVLRGEPIEYEEPFKAGDKPRFQFQLNIVVKENQALSAKILRGGWKLYEQLRHLAEAGWEMEKVYMKISRTGTTQNDTVYSATPSPVPVPQATLDQVAQVKLHELIIPGNEQHAQPQPGDFDGPPAQTDADVPF